MVVEKTYEILSKSPGYSMGMIPDWMRPDGNWAGSLGYNAYFNSRAFFKDAIRILWRVAIDAVWFDESRAKDFLKNSLAFINSKGGAAASNFYQIEKAGELLPADDIWTDFNDSKNESTWRYRREHSHLTVGMWSTAALAVGESADRIAFSEELGKFYEGGDFFGNAVDPTGGIEDTLHNEMYFDQFLAWFGASMMSGTFMNVIDAIDNPKAATPGDSSSLTKPVIGIAHSRIKASADIRLTHVGNAILFTLPEVAEWSLYDMNGHKIAEAHGSNFLWQKGNQGVYIIKARSKGTSYMRKVAVR